MKTKRFFLAAFVFFVIHISVTAGFLTNYFERRMSSGLKDGSVIEFNFLSPKDENGRRSLKAEYTLYPHVVTFESFQSEGSVIFGIDIACITTTETYSLYANDPILRFCEAAYSAGELPAFKRKSIDVGSIDMCDQSGGCIGTLPGAVLRTFYLRSDGLRSGSVELFFDLSGKSLYEAISKHHIDFLSFYYKGKKYKIYTNYGKNNINTAEQIYCMKYWMDIPDNKYEDAVKNFLSYSPSYGKKAPAPYTYSQPATTGKTAVVDSVWVTNNVDVGSQKGLSVSVKLRVEGMKGQKGSVVCYFNDERGNKLKDTNDNYRASDGQITTSQSITPSYDNSTYSNLVLTIPYSELHLPDERERELLLDVFVWDVSSSNSVNLGSKNNIKVKINSQESSFTVDNKTDIVEYVVLSNGFRNYVKVRSPKSYDIKYLPSWCEVSNKTDNGFVLEVKPNNKRSERLDWFYVQTDDSNKIKVQVSQMKSSGPVAEIKEVTAEHNLYQNGQKGMLIKVRYETDGFKGRKLMTFANFYKEDNVTMLINTYGRQVSVSGTANIPYDSTIATEELFLPYAWLNMPPGFDGSLSYDIIVCDENFKHLDTKKNNGFTYRAPSAKPVYPVNPFFFM